MLRNKLVFCHRDDKVEERLLLEPIFTLTKSQDICYVAKWTNAQLSDMTGGINNVTLHAVQGKVSKMHQHSHNSSPPNKTNQGDREFWHQLSEMTGGINNVTLHAVRGKVNKMH